MGVHSAGGRSSLLIPMSRKLRRTDTARSFVGKVAAVSKIARSLSMSSRRSSGNVEGMIRGRATSGSGAPEIKNVDSSIGVTVTSAVPLVSSLCSQIAEGVTGFNRVGQKIHVRSVDCIFNVRAPVSNTNGSFCDLFLVWDKQPDGNTAAAGTIFVSPTTNLTFTNRDNLDRFMILRREHCNFAAQTTGNGEGTKQFQWHVPLDLVSRFTDATGNPKTNDLLICALCPGSTGSFNVVEVTGIIRLKFTDP